jgi:hypothetical protein
MQSTPYTFRSQWRAKNPAADGKSGHAEIAALASLNLQASDIAVGFIQNGAPCENCHKVFKKQSAGNSKRPFLFVIAQPSNGKMQGGIGYPILAGMIIINDEKNVFGARGDVRDGEVARDKMLQLSHLPVTLMYWQGRCYFGGLPAGTPITQQHLEALVSQA